jgi:hypothetical protein
MTRHIYDYPGSPVPPRSKAKARIIGLAVCVAIGAVIGWRLGRVSA